MKCPHCNADNRDGAKFCNECGMPLSGKMAEVAAALESDTEHEEGVNLEPITSEELKSKSGSLSLSPKESIEDSSSSAHSSTQASSGSDGETLSHLSDDEEGETPDKSSSSDECADADASESELLESSQDNDQSASQSTQTSDSLLEHVPHKAANWDESSKTADLSGIDECLVDAHYVPPKVNWRTGDTMTLPRITDAEDEKPEKFSAPDEPVDTKVKDPRKLKIILISSAVLVVLALVAAGVTYGLQMWGGKVAADVIGMTQGDAASVLQAQGFSVRATTVKSDETEGLVLLMDPGAGSRLAEGSEVVIHVSVGRVMPELVGKNEEEAKGLLAAEGLENIEVVYERSAEEEGLVLSMTPEPGIRVKAGEKITLTVAQRCTVPDITGMSYDAANAAIEEAGLKAQREVVYDQTVAEGTLLGTNPAAGEKLPPDTMVNIRVAESRSKILTDAAWTYLSQYVGSTLNIGGIDYQIISVDGITYMGNDTTAYTITCATTYSIFGETLVGAQKQKHGQIVWNKDNTVASLD